MKSNYNSFKITLLRHGHCKRHELYEYCKTHYQFVLNEIEEAIYNGECDKNTWPNKNLKRKIKEINSMLNGIQEADIPLSSKGIIQAKEAGEKIKENNVIPDIIFCSPFKRTKETIQYVKESNKLMNNIPVYFYNNIHERSLGLMNQYIHPLLFFGDNPIEARKVKTFYPNIYEIYNAPNAESIHLFQNRVKESMQYFFLEKKYQHIMIVSHRFFIINAIQEIYKQNNNEQKHIETPLHASIQTFELQKST